jgi:hypothetical protein
MAARGIAAATRTSTSRPFFFAVVAVADTPCSSTSSVRATARSRAAWWALVKAAAVAKHASVTSRSTQSDATESSRPR